jgi:hypothetical protein
VPGWLTSAVLSKPAMIAGPGRAAGGVQPELFRSKRLLEECRTFVNHANGKPPARRSGTHDDCVMAFAIAQAVRRELLGSGRKA